MAVSSCPFWLWEMGPAPKQRLSSAAGTEQQFLRLPQWLDAFLPPLALALPLLGTCLLHTHPTLNVEGGSGHSCPQAGLEPMDQALLPTWDPLQCSSPQLLYFHFTENNLVLKSQ